jgi:hypothetical protein
MSYNPDNNFSFSDDEEGGAAPRPDAQLDSDDDSGGDGSTPSADERGDAIRDSFDGDNDSDSGSDSFDDDDSDSGSSSSSSSSPDNRSDSGESDNATSAPSGPSANERAGTIGGEPVQQAADELDSQTNVDVGAQDVRLDRAEDGDTATASVGGAAADAIREQRQDGRAAGDRQAGSQRPPTPQNRAALPGETSPLSRTQADAVSQIDDQFPDADVTRQDVNLDSRQSGNETVVTAELSDEGRETVARGRAPFDNVPGVGDAFEAGAEAGVEYREITTENEERFNEVTPDTKEVLGASAAAVAAPEPVSTGTGVIVGGTILGAAALGSQLRTEQTDAFSESELEVPDQRQPSEVAVPDQPGSGQSELPIADSPGAEVRVPDRAPSQTTGEIDTPDTAPGSTGSGEVAVSTSQLIQERSEREQNPEIGQDDIVTGIGQPDQPGPSTRERQERDDLFSPERTFPTGGGAVIGRSVAEEEATEPSVTSEESLGRGASSAFGTGAGVGNIPGLFGGVGGREGNDIDSLPAAESAVRSDTAQTPLSTQAIASETGLFEETAQPAEVAEPTVTETVATEPATGFGSGAGTRSGTSTRLPRPDLDDDDDELLQPLNSQVSSTTFDTGVSQSISEISEEADDEYGAGGL